MAGFIMTLDSDDDTPRSPSPPPVLTSRSKAPSKPAPPAKPTAQSNKLTKKQRQKQKRADVGLTPAGLDDSDEDDAQAAPTPGAVDPDGAKMDKGFVFDGFGGGFVGRDRNSVWDSGEAYIQKRPNAMPRVTVDEIIARRAPERAAAKAAAEAQALLDDEDDEEGSDDDDEMADSEIEKEMLAQLEDGELDFEGIDDDSDEREGGSGDDEDESEDDGAGEGEGDEDEGSADEAEKPAPKPKKADTEAAKVSKAEVEDDEDNWLGLGEKSEGEEDEEAADEEVKAGPTGFAALADAGSDMSDVEASDAEDDAAAAAAAGTSAADVALAKSFFTSHRNTSTLPSKKPLSFTSLPSCTLSRPLLLALQSLSLSVPTPIQAECIPLAMLGKDIVASSATGSGKTVAFWVGVLERLLHRDRKNPMTRVVVMTPTRELAVQVHGVGRALARYTDVSFCLCVGGLSLKVQEAELKQRPDIVVSTPGRLIDHVRNTPCFTMDGVEVLVLDEADRMLEEGFRDELEEIIGAAPRSRQTLLFSATVTESIQQLTRLSMSKPVRVKIDEMGAAAKGLEQEFLRVRGDRAGESIELNSRSGERHREALLVALCTRSFATGRTIIFFRSKAQAHRMKILFSLFGEGLERSDELHGDLTQEQRLSSLKRFREGEIGFLLATDLASRGLDIKGIENVINYEMPKSIEIYLHRVGRTARAGRKGRALTLVGESDRKLVKLAMKHAPPESVKQRSLPTEAVAAAAKTLRALEPEVKAVYQEEREEKEFRRGNMELTKASNLLEHEAEIKSRPARTWFQSQTQKDAAKKLGKDEHNSKFSEKERKKRPHGDEEEEPLSKPPKRTAFSGLSRRDKRRKLANMEDEEDAQREMGLSARAAKKAQRPTKITQAKPEREPRSPLKKKKKNAKGSVFDRESGLAGEAAGGKEKRAGKREREAMKGGGAGGGVKNRLGRMGPKKR
ncbi:P-loop containing nucleoside triphosphate hydrolase protein [Rhodotorula diobovata]|uniref:RNA helicase n=1 Tax=Rhodotorula diobovata TaxID=5288 RepID=A0A5C5FZP0_9BASI|nr:P-loop containing nucleoside triphosphate hydrolase protein [Rhodotorula diobovata]